MSKYCAGDQGAFPLPLTKRSPRQNEGKIFALYSFPGKFANMTKKAYKLGQYDICNKNKARCRK